MHLLLHVHQRLICAVISTYILNKSIALAWHSIPDITFKLVRPKYVYMYTGRNKT